MSTRNSFVFLGLAILLTIIATARSEPIITLSDAQMYLYKFGYLPAIGPNSDHAGLLDDNTWTKAIEDFQNFAGLNVTGELDEETKKIISLPRCGVPDKVFRTNNRSKRYALQGSRWKSKDLTYGIAIYPDMLDEDDVDAEIARAWAVWSEYTDLTFTRKFTGKVNILIEFVRGEHGDGDPFDGKGGTLAHAFFPIYDGGVHFDADESWTIDSHRGTNIFQVAAHEFGHALGLSHSNIISALMAPFYRGYDPDFKLHDDDISAIQELYGNKTSQSTSSLYPTSTTPKAVLDLPSGRPNKELCNDPRIDTIFHTADNETYVFKGDKYYKLREMSVAYGYPKLISEGWPGLPGNIDAAFTYADGTTFFFKGTQVWRYNGRRLRYGYPKEISDVFPGIPDNLDAAMVWGPKSRINFFKGSKFWSFDISYGLIIKSSYTKYLYKWKGFPKKLDAAIKYNNGYKYFFAGDKFYKFKDDAYLYYKNKPIAYDIGIGWFECI